MFKFQFILFIILLSIINTAYGNDIDITGKISDKSAPSINEKIVVFTENDLKLGETKTNRKGEFRLSLSEPIASISLESNTNMNYLMKRTGEKQWKIVLYRSSNFKDLLEYLNKFWLFLGPIFGGIVGAGIQFVITMLKRKSKNELFQKIKITPLKNDISEFFGNLKLMTAKKTISLEKKNISSELKRMYNDINYLLKGFDNFLIDNDPKTHSFLSNAKNHFSNLIISFDSQIDHQGVTEIYFDKPYEFKKRYGEMYRSLEFIKLF